MANMPRIMLCFFANILVVTIGRSASGETLSNSDCSKSGYYPLSSRKERSIIKIAEEVLARMKEAFDSVMSGAREVKYLSSINYKVLVKGGGREQAKRDFDEFRLSSIHHFTIRRSGTGRLGEIGDKIIVLEDFKDVGRSQLIIKPRFNPEAGEYTYRILYRDQFFSPKGRSYADE